MKKILIIGAGAMGSAFSIPCIENNNEVTIIGSVLENDFISSIKSNKNLHPSLNVILPNNIKIEKFEKITEVTDIDLDLIVVGVSSVGIDWVGEEISKFYKDKIPIILLTKGLSIIDDQLTTLTEKLEMILKKNGHKNINISSVKGPCLASGLANKMRTGTIIANKNIKEAQKIQNIIQTEYYKCEISDDIEGIEISSAIKNLYSMLIGGSQGLSNPVASKEIQEKLKLKFNTIYDEKDAVGRRYRRQDAIGTPYCVTVDHQTLEDNSVTIRHRDTMKQERISIDKLEKFLSSSLDINNWLLNSA